MEEERRIFYVACSRAKKLLFLSYSEQESEYKNNEPDKKSKIALPFLTDILTKSGAGDKVRILNEKAGDFIKKMLHGSGKTGYDDIYPGDFSQIISDICAVDDTAGNFKTAMDNKEKRQISENIFKDVSAEGIEKMLAREVNALKPLAYNSSESNINYRKVISALKHQSKALLQAEDTPVKRNFSITELLVYLDCPRKYKWKYIYNIPEPSGKALLTGEKVHKIIQLLTMQIFGEIVDKNFLGQTNKAQVLDRDDRQIEEFLNNYKKSCFYSDPDVRKIILEQLFYWNLEGFIISCKIDRLDYMADGSIRIIDYKTSVLKGRKPAANYLNQLKAYAGGISSLFSIRLKLIKAFLFYLKDGKIHENNFEASEIAVFERSIVNSCEKINSRIFPIRLKDSCSKNCYYFTLCTKNRFS
jgi:ATP-dependent exoDNAse (exonuclease V) beta subunit